jgi:hypothetical protein
LAQSRSTVRSVMPRAWAIECVIHLEQRGWPLLHCHHVFVERDGLETAAALRGDPCPRPIREDVTHRDGGQREKVCPIGPPGRRPVRKFEIGLVHQRRCLKRGGVARSREMAMRNLAKLVVHLSDKPIEIGRGFAVDVMSGARISRLKFHGLALDCGFAVPMYTPVETPSTGHTG